MRRMRRLVQVFRAHEFLYCRFVKVYRGILERQISSNLYTS